MTEKTKKVLKTVGKVGAGAVAFMGTLVGGYVLTPNRTKYVSVEIQEPEKTAFEQFVTKVSEDVGLNESEEVKQTKYMSAEFDNLQLKYSIKDSDKVNTIKLDGELDFRMHELSLSGIEFNVDANVNYNGKDLPLVLGHFKDVLYFRLKDLKLKCSSLTTEDLFYEYYPIFAEYAGLDFGQMYYSLDDLINEKLNGLIDGLMSGGSTGGLNLGGLSTSEEKVGNQWVFTLTVAQEESEDITITIYSGEDFSLQRVDLGTISVGDFTISGGINFSLKDYDSFVSPAEDSEYVEIFNYSGLAKKFASLLKEGNQKLGLEFNADLNNVTEKESVVTSTDIAYIEGSINVDFDKLLDLSQYTYVDPFDDEAPAQGKRARRNDPEQSNSLFDTIKDAGFNLQLDLIGQNDVEYANLDLAFVDGSGYLKFNEQEDAEHNKTSVMKFVVEPETMNWMMTKLPEVINGLSGDENNASISTLLDFLSDDLADAIRNGDYSFILDMLQTLRNDNDKIELGLDLSALGIGDNASVNVAINNDLDLSSLDVDVNGLAFGDFTLDLGLNSASFKDVELGTLSEYQSVKFIPDVVEQVTDLIKEPKSGFDISGSVLSVNDGTGITLSGQAKFDNTADVKAGYGNLTINQYKYHANDLWATHNIYVDVTNKDENVEKIFDGDGNLVSKTNNNKALFIYGNPNANNVKGEMKLQSFLDIIDIVKTFIGDAKDDEKFTKFLAPITKLLGVSALGDIISSKDYLKLASNELLKEISVYGNGEGLRIVVGGSMIGLNADLTLLVNFAGNYDDGNQKIESISIDNLVLGEGDKAKAINIEIGLKDYDFELVNQIEAHRNENYMNLDGITTLLQLGINTTKLNYYHLTADGNVEASVLGIDIPIPLKDIDFHIYVDGVRVKVYGKIGSLPLIIIASEDHSTLSDRTMSAEFTFETYADDEKPEGDDVGGVFNIRRIVDTKKTGFSFKQGFYTYHDMKVYHYKTDSSNFMDNIVTYLLGDLFGIKMKYVNAIVGDSSSSSSIEEVAARDFTKSFTSTGFSHQTTGSGMNTVETIKLGLNLDILTGIDALKEAEITLKSKRIAYQGNPDGLDILAYLKADLRIHFAVDINASLTAQVLDAEYDKAAALTAWNTSAQSNFNTVTSVDYPSANYNKPSDPYITEYTVY